MNQGAETLEMCGPSQSGSAPSSGGRNGQTRKTCHAMDLDHLLSLVRGYRRPLKRKEERRDELGFSFPLQSRSKDLHDGHGRCWRGSNDGVVDLRLPIETFNVGVVWVGSHGVLEEQDSSQLTSRH